MESCSCCSDGVARDLPFSALEEEEEEEEEEGEGEDEDEYADVENAVET